MLFILDYNGCLFMSTKKRNRVAGLRASGPLKNAAEEAFRVAAGRAGWLVSKRGWPDFICVKGARFMAVEVKAVRRRTLKREQLKVMELLAGKGVECFRWSPGGGFQRVGGPTELPQ